MRPSGAGRVLWGALHRHAGYGLSLIHISNFLERLYNACVKNDAQISCCYYYYLFPNSGFTFEYPFRCSGVLTREEAMNKLLRDMQIQSLVWNKMYKRSLFTDYNIQFPSIAFEDMATANRVFAHAERIAVLDEPL